MRRLALASALLLAGCATRPETPPPVPQQPVQATPAPRAPTQLAGLTIHEVVQHFGRPALQIQEGSSLKLQFRGSYCVLDAYFYPSTGNQLRVTHVDTRTPSGSGVSQAACISALELQS
jgi:hypothetical protein